MSQMIYMCRNINTFSLKYGGEDSIDWFFRTMGFWSSTEVSSDRAQLLIWEQSNTAAWRANGYQKGQSLNTRAFHRF